MSKSMCLQPPRGTVRELRPVSGEREVSTPLPGHPQPQSCYFSLSSPQRDPHGSCSTVMAATIEGDESRRLARPRRGAKLYQLK